MSRLFATLTISLFAAATMFAQLTGRLSGTVIDQAGASIPNARVGLYLPGGKNARLATTTNAQGIFDFLAVRPDLYMLVIESPGFTKHTQADVKIDPARQNALPPIALSLSTSTQTVEVSANVTTVDTASAEIATTVTQAQITNLPVLDRQINNLFVLQAGVAQNGRANTVINGLRPTYTNLLLDGINIQDSVRTNDLDYLPNKLTIAQVAEFTVSTSNASPTIGGAASTITLITPSGSNQFHGAGYWSNRNNFFSASDWFNNKNGIAKSFLNLNQLGGTIGGPVIKDRLFFFGNYEALRQHQTSHVNNTILTPTARQGIVQYKVNGATQQFDVLKASNLQISPVIQNLLSGVPTIGNNNGFGDGLNTTGYTFNARQNTIRDNVTVKGDYNLSTKNVFSASYIWNRDNQDRPDQTPFYSLIPPIFNANKSTLVSGSWRWTPTSALTNEVRGGFNRGFLPFNNRQKQPAYFITGLNFSSPIETGEVSEGRRNNTYSFQDNANWLHGKHAVSFGFQTSQLRVHAFGSNGTIPSYGIGISAGSTHGFNTGDIPGASSTDINRANSLLASLAGLVASSSQTFNPTSRSSGFVPGAPYNSNLTFNNYALYALDNFKLRRNLTLTLGLRWDYFPPVDESNGLLVQPLIANHNAPATLLGNATLDFAGNAVGHPLYKRDLNNFAPNIALAWDVFGDGKTSIRTGFNIAYLNDNALNDAFNVGQVNNGLTVTRNTSNLIARADAPPPIATPVFQVPTTTLDQFNLSKSSPPAQAVFDPNLATPYVEQWTFAIQREVKGFIFEGRYVGNHGVKVFRQIDYNQINVNQGGFLQDFIRARNNGFLAQNAGKGFVPAYNADIPGSQPLTFFTQLPSGGALTSASVLANIRSGEVGTLGQLYQSNLFFPFPGFSYFPNPLSLYSSAVTNLSNSSYNAAQFEVRKRTQSGLQFQANYTFGKALTDSFAQRQLDAQLDNNNRRLERARANFDQTHAFKLNHYIPLPIGDGKRIDSHNRFLNRVIGDWALSGFLAFYSGNPVAIYSARGTLNRAARSAFNTVDTPNTLGELQRLTGVFTTGNGVYWFNPANIGPNTQGVAPDGSTPFPGQVFFNPQPGTLGSLQRRDLNAPWYKSYDFAISKVVKITERQTVELHADFYNLLNHPNFFINDQNPNGNNFGKFTSQYYSTAGVGPRSIQFALYYKF